MLRTVSAVDLILVTCVKRFVVYDFSRDVRLRGGWNTVCRLYSYFFRKFGNVYASGLFGSCAEDVNIAIFFSITM